eukprot:scaffold499958_cov23-Prasinocladus_malaysianus.AAC.1
MVLDSIASLAAYDSFVKVPKSIIVVHHCMCGMTHWLTGQCKEACESIIRLCISRGCQESLA